MVQIDEIRKIGEVNYVMMIFALLLRYQSKNITLTGRKSLSDRRFITLTGICITSSGSYYIIVRFYYIIGQLLQWQAIITLSVSAGLLFIYSDLFGSFIMLLCRCDFSAILLRLTTDLVGMPSLSHLA